jgi:hypothetical protein
MTAALPLDICETLFTEAVRHEDHGGITDAVRPVIWALSAILSSHFFNQKNEFDEKVVFWLVKNNHWDILKILIGRFGRGSEIFLNIDKYAHNALEVALLFNDDDKLRSIIELLLEG